jgi:hypothetical protein
MELFAVMVRYEERIDAARQVDRELTEPASKSSEWCYEI